MDLFAGLEARPLSIPGLRGLRPVALYLGQGIWGLEVAVFEADGPPPTSRLRSAWKKRSQGRATPLVLLVLEGETAHVCGPLGDQPPVYHGLSAELAARICRVALEEPTDTAAIRFLRSALPDADSRIPGVRSEGLLATHELRRGVPSRPDWPEATSKAGAVARLRGAELVRGLGFSIRPKAGNVSLLCVEDRKSAVAVFLDRSEQPEAASPRFGGSSPISYALAKADEEGLGYVVVAAGPVLRLYPVRSATGVSARGRPETYLELHLDLLPDDLVGYLWLVFSAEALRPGGTFEDLVERSERFATDLGKRLRDRIYEGVIGRLATAIARARDLEDPTAEELDLTYRATLILLFRLLFIAYAEDRDLLPYRTSTRYQTRSLKRIAFELRDIAREGRAFDPEAHYWREVQRLCRAVDKGQREWGVPAYDGGLFSSEGDAAEVGRILDEVELGNDHFAPALAALLLDESEDGDGRAPVDFRSLGVREFGTIYEGLLECELSVAEEDLALDRQRRYRPVRKNDERIDVTKGDVYLHDRSGSRKATGSYYTKDFAVEHLLDQALEPALTAHLKRLNGIHDAEVASQSFFEFRVADIAMGSGHFLVAAIDRIERRFSSYLANRPLPGVVEELRRLRAAAESALGDAARDHEIEDTQLLRRQIARRCIFGVDHNPMAVDLSRLSVWVHTFVPGLPLSFLDHNLVAGNSLVGIATFAEAMVVAGQGLLFGTHFLSDLLDRGREAVERLGTLADADAAEVRQARAADREVHQELEPLRRLFTILAASRIDRYLRDLVQGGDLMDLADDPDSIPTSRMAKRAAEVLRDVHPFHFPTEFPEVFRGDRPGFDVVVGNPPWEEASIEEDDFWTRYVPGFQALPQAERERLVRRQRKERPDLVRKLEGEQERAKALRELLGNGPFPGMGTGDPDLYKAFCWRFWSLVKTESGRIGVVLPRSAFSAKGSTEWRKEILASGTFTDLTFLLNSGGWAFDEAEPRYTIALVALQRRKPDGRTTLSLRGPYRSLAEFRQGVARKSHRFPLADVLKWTDNASLPLLPDDASTEIFAKLREAPRFDHDDRRFWLFRPYRELDATNDKKLMRLTSEQPDGCVPVYKGESFDLWQPDTGAYYGWAEPDRVLSVLKEKRARSARKKGSPWAHLDGADLASETTLPYHRPRIAFRDVARSTDTRTVKCALVPGGVFITNKGPYLIRVRGDEKDEAYMLGILTSIPLDWFARRFVEINLNFFIFNMLPVPRPKPSSPLWKRVVAVAGRLASTDRRFADWAEAVGVEWGPLDPDERDDMVAELDALSARLYDLSEAQLVHLFETFHEGWDFTGRLEAVLRHYRELAPAR